MDFPLSSSVILVVAVVLWIVWVAPYVLRNRRQFQAAAEFPADAPATESSDPRAGTVMNMTAQQEKPMDIRKIPEATPDSGSASTTGRFRIRYGRTGIALVGVATLLTAFVSGVLLLFRLGTPLLPVSCLAVTLALVVLLRRLAVRDRKAKVNAAFSAAMSAAPRRQDSHATRADRPAPAEALPDSQLFDAEAHQARPQRLTAMELREAALAVALEAGDTSVRITAEPAPTATWQPVDVPKPVYVEAAKAERPAPEPLDLPEAPKAQGKPSLKQGSAAAPPAAPAARPLTKAQSALSNLDDVLQRRRA